MDLETPARVVAFGAHPDDVEFGCGGTLAKWADGGCAVTLVVCTDGSKGSWSSSTDPSSLVDTRRSEQLAAAAELAASAEVVFLDWPDGELVNGAEQRRQIVTAIRQFRPQIVLTHDPWRRYRLHPDHRNAGFLVTDGIVAARDPLFYRDLGYDPWRPTSLLLFDLDDNDVDHFEDVTSTAERRIAALLRHRSQFESTMHIDSHQSTEAERSTSSRTIDDFRRRQLAALQAQGDKAGVRYAECFKRLDEL